MKTTKISKKDSNPRARLGEYLGFTAVQIIRQMGKEGWKAKEASEALNRLGLKPNIHTCFVQVCAGRKGVGELATLPKKTLAALKAGKRPAKSPKAKATKKVAAATNVETAHAA